MGSNALAGGLDLLDAVAGEQARQLAAHHLEAGDDLVAPVAEGRHGPLQVVHHRQQPAHEFPLGARDDGLAVALGALAVVVELGLQALERVQVLVALGLERARAPPSRCGSAGAAASAASAGRGLGLRSARLRSPVGVRVGHAASAPLAATAILRGLTSSAFGTRTVSTPLSKVAVISSGFTPWGRVTLRWKDPYARSTR